MKRALVVLVVALAAPTASAQVVGGPGTVDITTPLTCDDKNLSFHRHRARKILKDAYATEPTRDRIRAYQAHKLCILDRGIRHDLAALRAKLKERWESDWCSPTPSAYGAGCWEIPVGCVMSESGGSWSAANPSGAVGPYQLLGHGAPFPVYTREQAMVHHRIAAGLYASQGLGPWVAPGC